MTVPVLESDLWSTEDPLDHEVDEERALKLLIISILWEKALVSGADYHELRIKMFGTDTAITHARFKRAVNGMVYGGRRHSPDLRVDMVVTRNWHGGLCDSPPRNYNLMPPGVKLYRAHSG